MKEFTLYLLSDAVQMCLQDYGYTALPLKVRACARADPHPPPARRRLRVRAPGWPPRRTSLRCASAAIERCVCLRARA